MPVAASARRYAQAAFELALEKGELEQWLDDLTLLADAVSNREFIDFLSQPRVTAEAKVRVVREALGDSVGPLALNLMSLLATRNIAHILGAVTDTGQEVLEWYRGIKRAEVVSGVELSDDERAGV